MNLSVAALFLFFTSGLAIRFDAEVAASEGEDVKADQHHVDLDAASLAEAAKTSPQEMKVEASTETDTNTNAERVVNAAGEYSFYYMHAQYTEMFKQAPAVTPDTATQAPVATVTPDTAAPVAPVTSDTLTPNKKVVVTANGMFFAQAGGLLLAFFAVIYAYSRTHEAIEKKTGLKLTHMCCITYATLSISIDLSIKNAAYQYGGKFPFNPACGVVVVEFSKLAVSLVLFCFTAYQDRAQGKSIQIPGLADVMWFSVSALVYSCNNLLVFQAIKSTPLNTFGVLRETMLIWNALIWTFVFQRPVSAKRWFAIFGIFLGCSFNQIPKMLGDEWTPGVIWAILLALSNAAGAVANEYAMKQRASLDINLQNVILYFQCGLFVLIGLAVIEPEYTSSAGNFFTGFVPECWQVIILQTFTGLAVSRILKYVEAVTKTIVAAVRGPGLIVFGVFIFHTTLGVQDMIATITVCISCFVFLREGPLNAPAKVEESKDEVKATYPK